MNPHKTWNKFERWLMKSFGGDLYRPVQTIEVLSPEGKTLKLKCRPYDHDELHKRLFGIDVINKVKRYVKKSLPEIKVINVDDSAYAGSIILLIPHPSHGITIMFIPQCSEHQNHFFMYGSHYEKLMEALTSMKDVYKENEGTL